MSWKKSSSPMQVSNRQLLLMKSLIHLQNTVYSTTLITNYPTIKMPIAQMIIPISVNAALNANLILHRKNQKVQQRRRGICMASHSRLEMSRNVLYLISFMLLWSTQKRLINNKRIMDLILLPLQWILSRLLMLWEVESKLSFHLTSSKIFSTSMKRETPNNLRMSMTPMKDNF